MGSEYNYDALGSLFGGNSSSQDPIAGLFDPNPDASHPHGTGGNLQLAPLYNNPRHQQEREGIGDILNRYQGRTGRPRHGDFYEDNYEEDLESHMSFDASGMHVGVRMSRSQQTPFGTARTSVGMQMSIGHGGMMFRSRSSSSLGGGGRGGLLMMSGFGGSPYHSLGQSMFEPMGSMLSPLGGLLSPLGGMFSPMIGSYNPGQEPPLFGFRRPQRASSQNQGMNRESDGPIIEEIFDEEESRYLGSRDESAFRSNLAVEYKEEEIDPSLGLGLLPDMETAYSGHNQSRSEQGESGFIENGILNDFEFTEAAQTGHSVRQKNEEEDAGSHETDTNRTQARTVTQRTDKQEDRYSFARKTKVNRDESSELTDRTLIENNITRGLLDVNKRQQSDNRKEDAQSKSKEKVKFTKQTFRNSPLKLNEDHDSLPFLRPPQETNHNFDTVQSDLVCAPKMKLNKNKQMNKSKLAVVNKNSVVRRRSDSSCSSSSEQSWTAGDNVRRPSEEIYFKPKSQLFSEGQNDDTNTAITCKETTVISSAVLHECPKTHECPIENNRVIPQEKHLSENTDGRYESLQDSDDDSKLVDGVISHNVYANKDAQPQSLQEAMANGTADKTSCETSHKTSEVETQSENIMHEITSARETTDNDTLNITSIGTASTGNRQSPTLGPNQGFRDDPDKKSNSMEQAVRYEHHNGKLGAEGRVETEVHKIKEQKINVTHDKLNDTECKLENESNAEMFRRSSSPQDFSTYESDVGNQDKKQSVKDINTASKRVEDDRVPLQENESTERESSLGYQFHDEEIDEREKHRAENVSEEQSWDLSVNLETTKDEVYSQHEGARAVPVLETFQFEPEEDIKMYKTGSNDIKQGEYQSSKINSERSRTKNLEHMSVPNQHQSNHRRQNMNESTINEDCGTDIEWQYPGQEPRSHHKSFSVNKFARKDHPYLRKGIPQSGGCHGHHMCGHEIIETSCMTNRYRCHHCSEVMSPKGYCERTHRCPTCGDEVMALKDYNKREPDNDDVYQFPNWQYLNEYRDENGQFTNPRPRTNKPKVNKNATAKTRSTASFSRQGQSSASGVQEAASCSNNFGGLVESVGLTMKDVYPDGNCLFTAICDQLRIRGDFSYTPRDLRHAAVDYLREHPNQEDGTPLLAFLADEERNWDKYLSSMRREGHWGDHFVIWALAHVLNRRFIIYRGNTELHRTVVEPSGPMSDDAIEDINADSAVATEGSECKEVDEGTTLATDQQRKPIQTDEMYLGHISESHYVSLRPTNWRDELFKELKNKKTSSLIGCNPDSKSLDCQMQLKQDVPDTHLTFALKFIRMSDVVFCPGCKDEPSEIPDSTRRSTAEFYVQRLDAMNGLLISSKFTDGALPNFKSLIIPLDTRIYNKKSSERASSKDLIFNTDNCTSGHTKLQACDPLSWVNSLNDEKCLKQLHDPTSVEIRERSTRYFILAFQSEWPYECSEWLTRTRSHNWPDAAVIDDIKENGCRVVPKCDPTCVCTLAVWKFAFDRAEKVLSERSVTEEQLDCFLVVKIALDNVLNEPLTLTQLKHVFFYMCEETEGTCWNTELAKCVWMFLDRLKGCVTSKNIPNYFMPQVNLLENVTDEYIAQSITCIDIVQKHPFAILFFMCDEYSRFHFALNTLFDRLVEDTRQFAIKRDIHASIRLCFLPIIADSINGMVVLNKYMTALERCQIATEKLNQHVKGDEQLHLEDVIQKVIFLSNSSINQWMFAFVADQKLGTFFTETVCEGKETVSLFSYYGPSLADNLGLQAADILIPFDLVTSQNLAETTFYMLGILEEICTPAVYHTVLEFFLSNHMSRLVRTASSERNYKFATMIIEKIKLKISNIMKQ